MCSRMEYAFATTVSHYFRPPNTYGLSINAIYMKWSAMLSVN